MLGSRVVKGVWQVKEELALDYLVTDSSSPGVTDVWVDWKQVLLLLGELKPKFSQIWTLKDILYCPLLDVLQLAITSTGFVSLRGLLDSLVQSLLAGEHLVEVDYQIGESNVWQSNKDKSQEEEPRQIISDDLKKGEGEQQDPQLDSNDGGRRKVPAQLSCTICSKQLAGQVRLYSHYVSQHPDSPSLHPARPHGALHACPDCGELYSRQSLLRRQRQLIRRKGWTPRRWNMASQKGAILASAVVEPLPRVSGFTNTASRNTQTGRTYDQNRH